MSRIIRYLREYNPVFAFSFVSALALGMIYYLLPIQIEAVVGGVFWVGMMYGIANIFCMIIDIPAGNLIDLVGERSILSKSALMLLFASLLLSVILNQYGLFLLVLVIFILDSISTIAHSAYIVETGKKPIIGEIFGINSFLGSVAGGMGPILAGVMASIDNSYAFYSIAAIFFVAVVVSLRLKDRRKRKGNKRSSRRNNERKNDKRIALKEGNFRK